MNLILNILQRLFNSPKTTAGGLAAGTGLSVAVSMIVEQSGCHFEGVNWWVVMSALFGGPAVVGALATDNGVNLPPAVTIPTTAIKPVLVILAAFGLGACSSYVDLGNGKAMRTVLTEERSPFGTNAGWMQLQECDKIQDPDWNMPHDKYVNCHPHSVWTPIHSQGQGGQVVGGALTGLGFGLGNAFSGATSSSASSSAASSSAVSGGRGH